MTNLVIKVLDTLVTTHSGSERQKSTSTSNASYFGKMKFEKKVTVVRLLLKCTRDVFQRNFKTGRVSYRENTSQVTSLHNLKIFQVSEC